MDFIYPMVRKQDVVSSISATQTLQHLSQARLRTRRGGRVSRVAATQDSGQTITLLYRHQHGAASKPPDPSPHKTRLRITIWEKHGSSRIRIPLRVHSAERSTLLPIQNCTTLVGPMKPLFFLFFFAITTPLAYPPVLNSSSPT